MSIKPLARLPSHSRVFVDTNIFVLHYTDRGPLGQTCRDFLERTTRLDLDGYTSVIVVSETIHRLIVAEAAKKLSLSSRETVEYLQKHPDVIKTLKHHLTVASEIYRMGIDILPVTYQDLHRSKIARADFGLMANDSLVVATMRAHGLVHLATHDTSFERVQGLQVWCLTQDE